MQILEREIVYNDYSLVDNFGRVFFWNNKIFRGLTDDSVSRYDDMRSIGLLGELESLGLIPFTTISDFQTEKYRHVLEHKLIKPATFSYEWSFDMVKAAGFCILEVNKIALKYGYETIDAHPYNVFFIGCVPVFLDLGSFRKIVDGPWVAAEEFLGSYVNPLILWNTVNLAMARRMLADDVSYLTSYEFKQITKGYNPFIKLKEIFKNRILNRIQKGIKSYSRQDELASYHHKLAVLKRESAPTSWQNYHDEYIKDSVIEIPDRFRYIIKRIKELGINNITELAGNWGLLSYLILKEVDIDRIICSDYDEVAVNKMYNFFLNSEFRNKLSPVMLNFMKPVELANAGRSYERLRSQAVLALAITHHLVLSNKFNIDVVLERIAKYSDDYIFTEFMPLGLWDGKQAPSIPSWYNQEWFTERFCSRFELVEITQLEENRILYIGKIKPARQLPV